jgi:hypothetical protein
MIDILMPKIKRMRLKSPDRHSERHGKKRPRSTELFQQHKISKPNYDSLYLRMTQSVKSKQEILKAIVNIQRIYRGWKYKHIFHVVKYPFYSL